MSDYPILERDDRGLLTNETLADLERRIASPETGAASGSVMIGIMAEDRQKRTDLDLLEQRPDIAPFMLEMGRLPHSRHVILEGRALVVDEDRVQLAPRAAAAARKVILAGRPLDLGDIGGGSRASGRGAAYDLIECLRRAGYTKVFANVSQNGEGKRLALAMCAGVTGSVAER